ncbi:hypothetical protein WH52_09365 [Tenacibaculum holothuriorum]|uniref:Peptidyl-prolyl cis-trans isomerase n=1 Tax=Tenacibaculum holothuriorum TaxID=1635173 RepID=A0A1Y2PBL6_9FLAO|nr:hypothetical protein WH52_09365 [Tenacibaculum holothuriorum]
MDSVSYAIGLNMGMQMKKDAKELDASLFVQGYLNGVDSTDLLIKPEETRNIINAFFQKKRIEMMKKKQEEQIKKAEAEFGEYKKENEKFIAENKTKEGVKTTASGLQYIVVKEGKGESPKATSRVRVNYVGKLTDGTEFDKSGAEPTEFGVNQVIKGWTEGLQLMKPGAKYKFFIPQELAYGAQQKGAKIKPFSALVFDVELVEVK